MISTRLAGRVALVTGASSGIGKSTAQLLARNGALVGIHYNSNAGAAEDCLKRIRDDGGSGVLIQGDLSDPENVHAIVDKLTTATSGRLDILVNNAGSPVGRATIEECSYDLWKQILDVNLTAHFLIIQRAIPYLRKTGKGAIVNNLSLSVQTGGANGGGPYAAAKGGLQVLTRTLARELAPEVRTNAVMPGVIETPHHERFTSAARMQEYRAETPLGRNGAAEEVAQAILFLASDASSFLNGALLDVNGGRFLR